MRHLISCLKGRGLLCINPINFINSLFAVFEQLSTSEQTETELIVFVFFNNFGSSNQITINRKSNNNSELANILK